MRRAVARHFSSGLGFCFRAHSSSHLIAAARDANRFLKRKSSSRFRSSGSMTKFNSGFSLGIVITITTTTDVDNK